MSDDIEFQMTYPCYFLCGDRGGLVCITVDFVTCLCLFTDINKLNVFQQNQQREQESDLAFPLQIAFAPCHNGEELIERLTVAKKELADSDVRYVAINPVPGEAVPYITIREFVGALPRD